MCSKVIVKCRLDYQPLFGEGRPDTRERRKSSLCKVMTDYYVALKYQDKKQRALTWIKACLWLMCDVLGILFKFSLFHKILASNCLVICKMFFCLKITRVIWSRDWPRPKMKEIWLFKLEDLNVLEIPRFIFKNLNLTLVYVVLNGDSKDVLFFSHYFLFLSSPSPSPIDIRCYGDKRNKSIKAQSIL